MRDAGWIDEIVHRERQQAFLGNLLDLMDRPGTARIGREPSDPATINHPAGRDAMQAVRDPARPSASWYAEQIVGNRVELRGDRGSGDATCVRAGIGRIDGVSVVYAALDAVPGATAGDAAVRKLIRSGQASGQFARVASADTITFTIFGVINELPLWYRPGGRKKPAQIGAELADFVLAGLEKP